MARPKRNNSSGDPAARPKIIPVSPRRKQARSIPPTSSVHDEASIADRAPTVAVLDSEGTAQNRGSCDSPSSSSSATQTGAGLLDRGVDASPHPPQTKTPLDGKKRLAPQRRGVSPGSRKCTDGEEKQHGPGDHSGARENYEADTTRIQLSPQSSAPATTILSLPNELLLQIAHTFREPDLNRLSRSNQRLYVLLTHRLYRLGKEIEYLDGSNLLHWAAERCLVNTVRHLLDEGANPNSKFQRASHPLQADGRTPLHIAAEKGSQRIAKLLLQHGAKTKVWDRDGNTPLHLAVANGRLAMVKLLVRAGAKITARDAAGMRPLHVAIQDEKPRLVRLLLRLGADVAATDRTGGTALHLAASFCRPGLCSQLLAAGADPNARDLDGMAPLHWASYTGWEPVARLLVRHGARPHDRDDRGRLPWHWAGVGGNADVFAYLAKLAAAQQLPLAADHLKDKDGEEPRLRADKLPLTGIPLPVCPPPPSKQPNKPPATTAGHDHDHTRDRNHEDDNDDDQVGEPMDQD